MTIVPSVRRVLAGGLAYVVLYALVAELLPPPAASAQRMLLAGVFLLLPAAVAFALTGRAAREARGAERVFWGLLSGAALAYGANVVCYGIYRVALPQLRELLFLGHLGYYTSAILVVVALLVRPERPLAPAEVPAAALEWSMALVGGYFLLFYFVLLPAQSADYPWFLVYTAQELLPALLALAFALLAREEPFRSVYRLLALGLGSAAIASVYPGWLQVQGRRHLYSAMDVPWVLPFVFMAAAALCPRAALRVRASRQGVGDQPRAWLASMAVAIPPLLDLGLRASGAQPPLAGSRSDLALGASALLSILVALRLRLAARALPAAAPESEAAAVPATELLELSSGAAHELNNPLMAVAGWTELAERRGAPAGQLAGLHAAVSDAADAVARLQRLARTGAEPGGDAP